jgi:hypothetical protein
MVASYDGTDNAEVYNCQDKTANALKINDKVSVFSEDAINL